MRSNDAGDQVIELIRGVAVVIHRIGESAEKPLRRLKVELTPLV
jgi:hypothetical protein